MSRTHTPSWAQLAPHAEPAWVERLVTELRLQGASGRDIGSVLAEVEAHAVDSGDAVADAFGDPVEYARGLGLAPAEEPSGARLRQALPGIVQLLGVMVLGIVSSRTGDSMVWRWGFILGVIVLLALVAALSVWLLRMLRDSSRVVAGILIAVAVAATPALIILLPNPALVTEKWVGWVVGVGALVIGTIPQVIKPGNDLDPVVAPWSPSRSGSRWPRIAAALALPVMGLVVVLIGLTLGGRVG